MDMHDSAFVVCNTGVEDHLWAVSDLHAADGSPADDFARNADLFYEFASKVGWNHIVCVGDILEGWQASRRDIEQQYPCITTLVAMGGGVRGNHDMRINPLPLVHREGNVVFAHGHQADPWNSRHRWVGRLATWFAGKLERCGLGWIDDKVVADTPATLDEAIYKTRYAPTLRRWVERMFYKYAPTALVFGHTHRAFVCGIGHGRAVANCGTWASADVPCTAIRIEPDRLTLVHVGK